MGSRGLLSGLAPRYDDEDFSDRIDSAFPFVAVMLLLPLLARFLAPISPAASLRSEALGIVLTLDLGRSSWIELTRPDATGASDPRLIPVGKFKDGIFGMFRDFYPKQAAILDSVSQPGIVLVCSGSTDTAFLAIDSRHINPGAREITVLGRAIPTDSNYDPTFMEESIALAIRKKPGPP
jgi:hypothetical protein